MGGRWRRRAQRGHASAPAARSPARPYPPSSCSRGPPGVSEEGVAGLGDRQVAAGEDWRDGSELASWRGRKRTPLLCGTATPACHAGHRPAQLASQQERQAHAAQPRCHASQCGAPGAAAGGDAVGGQLADAGAAAVVLHGGHAAQQGAEAAQGETKGREVVGAMVLRVASRCGARRRRRRRALTLQMRAARPASTARGWWWLRPSCRHRHHRRRRYDQTSSGEGGTQGRMVTGCGRWRRRPLRARRAQARAGPPCCRRLCIQASCQGAAGRPAAEPPAAAPWTVGVPSPRSGCLVAWGLGCRGYVVEGAAGGMRREPVVALAALTVRHRGAARAAEWGNLQAVLGANKRMNSLSVGQVHGSSRERLKQGAGTWRRRRRRRRALAGCLFRGAAGRRL